MVTEKVEAFQLRWIARLGDEGRINGRALPFTGSTLQVGPSSIIAGCYEATVPSVIQSLVL